jgi:hypothetical protein
MAADLIGKLFLRRLIFRDFFDSSARKAIPPSLQCVETIDIASPGITATLRACLIRIGRGRPVPPG